jgi:(p)ppGpp synthase/HD superfamily hydrolase
MDDAIAASLERAIALAVDAHRGHRDRAGSPYILHLMSVMQKVDDPIAKQAAVLHDYIEDVSGTIVELERHGIDGRAVHAIALLTRDNRDLYSEYIIALSNDSVARQVKLADIEDNFRIDRVAFDAQRQLEDANRLQKYILSHQFLSGKIDVMEYRERMRPLEAIA